MEDKAPSLSITGEYPQHYLFQFFDKRNLETASQVSKEWQKNGQYEKRRRAKYILRQHFKVDIDHIPDDLLQKYPVDFQALYEKLKYVPNNDTVANRHSSANIPDYLYLYALVGGKAFTAAQDNYGASDKALIQKGVYFLSFLLAFSGSNVILFNMFDRSSLRYQYLYDVLRGAVAGGRWQTVRYALGILNDKNLRNGYIQLCVNWAIRYRRSAMKQLLIDTYLGGKQTDDQKRVCLDTALYVENIDEVITYSDSVDSLLHRAVIVSTVNVLRCCVEKLQLDTNQRDENGLLPIEVALLFEKEEMVEYLLTVDTPAQVHSAR